MGHYFYVSDWGRDRHFTWSSEPREGLPVCRAKGVPSFLSYVSVKSFNMPPPPGIPRAFDTSAVPGRREFDYESLPGGGGFDPHALGVGNLNCILDFM